MGTNNIEVNVDVLVDALNLVEKYKNNDTSNNSMSNEE